MLPGWKRWQKGMLITDISVVGIEVTIIQLHSNKTFLLMFMY